MADRTAYLTVDLGYGDSGKGALIDHLCRTKGVHTVVRFNGGPQAGHNVVTPDGRHHTFSQYGSGTFVPGVLTYLSRYMLINPLNLLREGDHLTEQDVPDALERLVISPEAVVITPYHIAANRLRELQRGPERHGSCGMGIGETMADFVGRKPTLYAKDLLRADVVADKLRAIRNARGEAFAQVFDAGSSPARAEMAVFLDPGLIDAYTEVATRFASIVTFGDETWLRSRLEQPGAVAFEAAQGVLLDEDFGFHPYTTWSHTTLWNANALLRDTRYDGVVERIGLLRAYATRHGAGPFVTEAPELASVLSDPHNQPGDWQGAMRFGSFDAVATRYAIAAVQHDAGMAVRRDWSPVDYLAVSHLDQLPHLPARICTHYLPEDGPRDERFQLLSTRADAEGSCRDLQLPEYTPDLEFQAALTRKVAGCQPVYELAPMEREAFTVAVAREVGVPVRIMAVGPTSDDRHWWW